MLIAITTDEVLSAWQDAKATLAAEGLEIPPCLLEVLPGQIAVGPCRADLVVELQHVEGLGDRAAHDVLRQDVPWRVPRRSAAI